MIIKTLFFYLFCLFLGYILHFISVLIMSTLKLDLPYKFFFYQRKTTQNDFIDHAWYNAIKILFFTLPKNVRVWLILIHVLIMVTVVNAFGNFLWCFSHDMFSPIPSMSHYHWRTRVVKSPMLLLIRRQLR